LDGGSGRREASTYTGQHNTEVPQAGFENTILVFERSKTISSLDHLVTGTGIF